MEDTKGDWHYASLEIYYIEPESALSYSYKYWVSALISWEQTYIHTHIKLYIFRHFYFCQIFYCLHIVETNTSCDSARRPFSPWKYHMFSNLYCKESVQKREWGNPSLFGKLWTGEQNWTILSFCCFILCHFSASHKQSSETPQQMGSHLELSTLMC